MADRRRSGVGPIFPVWCADARNREKRYKGRYKDAKRCKRSSTLAEHARAGASKRERSGCLFFTPVLIASGIPRSRWNSASQAARFAEDFRRSDPFPRKGGPGQSYKRVQADRGGHNSVDGVVDPSPLPCPGAECARGERCTGSTRVSGRRPEPTDWKDRCFSAEN